MKVKNSNITAYDLGSSRLLSLVAEIDRAGHAMVTSQIVAPSKGLRAGVITNVAEAEDSLIRSIYELEKTCHKSIKEVVICFSPQDAKSYYVKESIKLGNNPITEQDLKKLITKILHNFKAANSEIIHYFPIEYIVDNKEKIDDPVGLYARELSCQMHIVTIEEMIIKNLVKCFAKCHVEIKQIILSLYSSALGVMSKDELELGSIIIDMGASTSSIGILLENKLLYTNNVPIGGDIITRDIARAFSISLNEAERIKILYGNASLSSLLKDFAINIENSSKTITSIQLAKIINFRLREIFVKLKRLFDQVNMDNIISKQIVITGGASQINGLKNLVEEIFNRQVRISKPNLIAGFDEIYDLYSCSAIVGIIKSKSNLMQKNYEKGQKYENFGFFKRSFLWLKENI